VGAQRKGAHAHLGEQVLAGIVPPDPGGAEHFRAMELH
jgi:hypothetical protein